MKKLISLIFILSISFAQRGWVDTYGGPENDFGLAVQGTWEGGEIVVGNTFSFGDTINGDVYLIKIRSDTCGDTLWTKTYGGANYDVGNFVQQTTDSGFIIAGFTNSFGAGDYDVYLIKTNASGDTLWTRTYGGAGDDQGYSVKQTPDGGYIVTGFTNSFGAGGYDVYLIKTNAYGDTLWTRTYGGAGDDQGNNILITPDGGGSYVITGSTNSYGEGDYDIFVIRTNITGNVIWTRTYGGNKDDFGRTAQYISDAGYRIIGSTESFGAGGYDVYLIWVGASGGDTIWTRTWGGPNKDMGLSSQHIWFSGGDVIVGQTNSFIANNNDVYIVVTSWYGETSFTRIYGGLGNDIACAVDVNGDGGYIIAGSTNSFGSGDYDVFLIKTKWDGDTTGVENNNIAMKSEHELKAIPNPFTSFTRIPGYENDDFAVLDISGRLIGNYKGKRIGDELSAGVYFITMHNDNLKSVRIVKIK